jgi:hypothetical protein
MDADTIAPVSETSWWDYVQKVSEGAEQTAIAERAAINKTTVWRWKTRNATDHEGAIRFARAYGRPITEALLAAGLIGEDEANLREVRIRINPADLDADELAEETKRFIDEMRSRMS